MIYSNHRLLLTSEQTLTMNLKAARTMKETSTTPAMNSLTATESHRLLHHFIVSFTFAKTFEGQSTEAHIVTQNFSLNSERKKRLGQLHSSSVHFHDPYSQL